MKFIRISKVIEITSLSRTQLYRLMQTGDFPLNVSLSERCSAWIEEEVLDWMEQKISAKQRSKPKI